MNFCFLFQQYRCRNLADPVIHGVTPAVICQFCKMKSGVYNPNHFPLNEHMCVVCGNDSRGPVPQAHLCQFHASPMAPKIIKCFLCDKIAIPNQIIPAKLCMNCGFGHHAKQCVHLDLH